MVAIHNIRLDTGILWSIDMDHNSLTQELKFQALQVPERSFCFTPDDKYIVCNTPNGPAFLSIAKKKVSFYTTHVMNYGPSRKEKLEVVSISPNNRQLIVLEIINYSRNFHITSYSMNIRK